MNKKTILLTLAASLLLGGAASAAEPSKSYMDSLIRAGQTIPMADGREHVVTNPRLIPSQTAPVRAGAPDEQAAAPTEEKKDLPALRYRGHGPARMPDSAQDNPEKRSAMGKGYGPGHGTFHGVGPARMPRDPKAAPAPDAPAEEKEKDRHPVFHGIGPAKMPKHHPVKPAPKETETSLTVGINIGPDHPHPHHRRHHHHRR